MEMRSALSLTLASSLAAAPPSALAADEAMSPEVVIRDVDPLCSSKKVDVAYNSLRDEYLVLWSDSCLVAPGAWSQSLHGRRHSPSGLPLGPAFEVVSSSDGHSRGAPSIAHDRVNDRYLVVFTYDYTGTGDNWDVHGRFLDWTGPRTDWQEFLIAWHGANELDPKAAFSHISQKFLVTYTANPGAFTTVHGAFLAFGGAPGGFPVGNSATGDRLSPDLSYDPIADRFAVPHDDGSDIFARFVDANPQAVGSEVAVSSATEIESTAAAASCENSQHLFTWSVVNSSLDLGVMARFFLGTGAVDGDAFVLYNSVGDDRSPDVACRFGGTDYLVAQVVQEATSDDRGVWGRRVSSSKTLRDPFAIRGVGYLENLALETPAVAGGKSGWFVVWRHWNFASSTYEVHGRAVWDLLADDFEWGAVATWSAATP